VQVYRRLDIGSAKVPVAQRLGIPHHMLDVVDPPAELTAGAYARLARETLSNLRDNRIVPLVVGGTGLYLRALLDGLSPAPVREPSIRARLSEIARRRPAALHRYLARCDPAAALRIHPNDHQKLVRAIELTILSGQSASAVQGLPRQSLTGFRILKIGLEPERSALTARLDERAAYMFRFGLLDETRDLLASGLSADSKPLQTLGYKQAVQVLAGQLSLAAAIAACQTATRQYAKRQMTWFRSDPVIHWLRGFGGDSAIEAQAAALIRIFLKPEAEAQNTLR
jgi:tRNA dimethylallyltransferase